MVIGAQKRVRYQERETSMIGAWRMPERGLQVLQAAAVGACRRLQVYVQQSLVVLV